MASEFQGEKRSELHLKRWSGRTHEAPQKVPSGRGKRCLFTAQAFGSACLAFVGTPDGTHHHDLDVQLHDERQKETKGGTATMKLG